ncbi:hypothetical protein KHX94_10820 [Shewanella dokdonensis]|uniref:Uncharacterized protein n=1 Tax=Shewanella dokdonensis TaxID=712036 RepID=A0ABX8DDY2_9GAMM|nr:hypothetical protein [Shewanella dokdonensis]QVK21982.1 hypothetical protein KHX94_10820 [Shewanella dokdonensis]
MKEQLNTLVLRGDASLKQAAKASALAKVWTRWLPWLPVAPMLILCVAWLLPWSVALSLLCLLPLLLLVVGYWFNIRGVSFSRSQALLQFGRLLKDDDRLTTADEFLLLDGPTPFYQLAVDDAKAVIKQALAMPRSALEHPLTLPQVKRWPHLLLTLLLSVLVGWFVLSQSPQHGAPDVATASIAADSGNTLFHAASQAEDNLKSQTQAPALQEKAHLLKRRQCLQPLTLSKTTT